MNTKHVTKRLMASLLCLVMLLGMAPAVGATAADTACDHGKHSGWATAMGGSFRPRGNVKLTGDVILDSTVSVYGELHICLNGYKITGNADPYFEVGKSGKLTICDCKGGGGLGTIPGSKGEYTTEKQYGFVTMSSGEFTLNGGTLTGNKGKSAWGGAVQLNGGTFTMNGGTITRNATQHYGGAISLNGASKFVMNGGTISENTSLNSQNGGAIVTGSTEIEIIINDGVITGNSARNGGAIGCRGDSGHIIINGGKFTNNVATENGSAIYMKGKLTINGGEFTGGTGGGAIYGNGTELVLTGGKISENTKKNGDAAGIVLDSSKVNTLDISGDPVVDKGCLSGKATSLVHDLKDGANFHTTMSLTVAEGDKSVIIGDSGMEGVTLYTGKPSANRGIVFDVEQTDGITFDAEKNELKAPEGTSETTKLTAKAVDSSVDLSKLTWESSDPAVATVKDGVITYKGWGRAVITARIPGANMYATINVWVDSSALKVLAVGNETTRDTLYYLSALGQAAGTPIVVGYLSHKEAVLRDHDNLMETNGTYRFYKTDASGKLVDQGAGTVPDALADEDWNAIILQTGLLHAGARTTFTSDLEYMVDYMEDRAPNAKLYWNMTWALKDGAAFDSMGIAYNGKNNGYNGSQALMYNYVVKCLETFITDKNAPYNSANPNNYGTGAGWGFDGWLYTGAAIQKLRQQTGKEPTRDGVYLSSVTGRLTAAVAALNVLVPSADLDKLAGSTDLINTVNAMKNDADGGVSGTETLDAATLSAVVNAVKAAGADAADGKLEKVSVPAGAVKQQSAYADFTVGREDGPERLRFGLVEKVGDDLIVTATRGIAHNVINAGEPSSLHFGGGEKVFWVGKENYTSQQWQESYENPVLILDNWQLHQWGAVPGGSGTIYDRYEAAKQGKTGYMMARVADADMQVAQIDMTGDGVKDDVILLTFWCNYYANNGNQTFQDARGTFLTYSLDAGKTWATPQWLNVDNKGSIQGHMKHGDIAVFNDGNILVPLYFGSGVTALTIELKFDTAAKKWVQIGTSRPITRPENTFVEDSDGDAWNEPTVISPNGGDTVYSMVRSTGHVQVSHDRGMTWTPVANEPGQAAQPRFIELADDLLLGSWQITTGNRRGGVSKLFYTDADWTDTHTQDVYITQETGGDLGDQDLTELSDGRIFAVNYDVKYNAIVGNVFDPRGKDFDLFKPIEVGMDEGEQTITLASAADVKLPFTAKEKVTGSHTVSAEVTFTSADGKVVIDTNAGTVTVPYTDKLALNQSAKVAVSVVGKYMYTRVTQGSYDSGWVSNHGDGNGTKTGISGTGITVKNAAVTRQVIIEMTESMAAAVGDEPKQIQCSLLPTMSGYTFKSANESIAKVSSTGMVSFVGAGSTEMMVQLGDLTKSCKVIVRPLSPEITGAGETMVFVDDDFESAPTYGGDNTYSVGDSIVDVDANNWYSFKSGADKTSMKIAEEAGNQYLKLSGGNAWFANTQDVVGDYTAQFDVKFDDHNLLYMTLWQTSNTGAVSNKVSSSFYLMSWGIKYYYTNTNGEKIAVPEGTTSSAIAYGTGCTSELAAQDIWVRVKVLRTEGSVYLKTWNRDYAEPDEWTFKFSDPALKVDGVGHLKIQGNGTGGYGIDNIRVTKQIVEGVGAMADVDPTAWYYDSVDYAINNNIMSGYNAFTFGPNDSLTRAMVVQVLYNKEGKPDLNGMKNSFSDVGANEWFNNAITWGANKDVVSGYGSNVFKPNQAVSIEQVAVILHNYSGKPAGNGDLSKVPGCSDWAAPALKWALEKGLLDGMPFGKITDKATRAQTAYMLMKYLKK